MCECEIAELKRTVSELGDEKIDLILKLIDKQVELQRAYAENERLRTKLGKAVGIIKRTMKSIASGKEARKMYNALHNEIYEIGPRPEINSTKKCCRDETKPCTGCLACCG